ncbi:MAG: sugar ABC transporter permease [Ktedonobacteraceae bacterium]
MAVQTQARPLTERKQSLRERLDAGSGLLPYFLVTPTIILILLIAVYPILDAVRQSFLDNPLSASGGTFTGLSNYIQIFRDPGFLGSIGTTFIFSFISVALEAIIGLGVAILINKNFPGRSLVRTSILIPFAFPTIVSAQIWLLMYNGENGIITYILQLLHLLGPGDSLLRTPAGVITAAIITDVWKTTPFMALLLLAGLQVIPDDLYEAAGVDGSTRWQQFWTITLPLLRNSFLIALLFRLLDALRAFDLFYLFTGGGREVQTLALYAYNGMFTGVTADFAPGVAAAVILFIICAIASSVIVGLTSLGRD